MTTIPDVVVFAILYGFFSGAGQCALSASSSDIFELMDIVLSLFSPTIASLSPEPSQIG